MATGVWKPTNSIAQEGEDGAPRVDWVGPQGAPLDFDLLVDVGDETGTWTGQIRLTPDAADPPIVSFSFSWASPVDGKVTGTATVVTTALTAGTCYVYGVARDQGSGKVPIVGGSLSPTVVVVR